MSFIFPDCDSTRFDFREVLKEKSDFTLEFVNDLNSARQRMCDTIASQPSSQAALDVIDEYLPYLLNILNYSDRNTLDLKKQKFEWRSGLSKGIEMSLRSSNIVKPMIAHASIYYEIIYVLIVYGFTLANMANKKLGLSFNSASDSACTEAADFFCRAAGVFKFVAISMLPRWSAKPKDTPPECSSEVLNALVDLMLAEANRAALAKAEKKGLSSATLLKLGVVVVNGYEQCVGHLKRVGKRDMDELADPFVTYIRDGAKIAEVLVLKRFADIKHGENENGVAVACTTQAYNLLISLESSKHAPYKKLAQEMVGEVDEMRKKYVRINNNITYQRVLEIGEAKSLLPISRAIMDIKGFVLPQPIECSAPVAQNQVPSQSDQQAHQVPQNQDPSTTPSQQQQQVMNDSPSNPTFY